MADFVVNIFQIRVAPIAHPSKNIKFNDAALDSIKVVADHLLDLKNKVSSVYVRQKGNWVATPQAIYLRDAKQDRAKGIFYGEVEVGSAGSFSHVRKRDGTQQYILKSDDLSMRIFFYRIEIPPNSAVGFLVVQRRGRNTAANAIQQSLRQTFHHRDYSIHFRLVTDDKAFNDYLDGRVTAVKARYIPHKNDARKTVQKSIALGSALSHADREDMDIKFKVIV